jgi:hypothetical protein
MSNNPYQTPQQWGQGPYQSGPNPQQAQVLGEISSQATASLVIGIISFFCFGIILAPFAIYRGSKALRLIQQYNIGHQHSGTANAGKIIGIVSLALNVIGLALYALVVCGSIAAQQ